MSKPLVFLSYRHGRPWTRLAGALNLKLEAHNAGGDFDIFVDSKEIRAGENWKQLVDAALARCTHFVALLCDEYWTVSNQCLRELYEAVRRRESSGTEPRLLFVLAAEMKPERLKLDAARQRGELLSDNPQIKALGDINFLGPFDDAYRLESLDWTVGKRLDRQLMQLTDRLLKSGGLPVH
ncbi:MAG TPA: toll/interleukin-1 receptor domain-containing protein [Albitalea sp.]|nr:toll/interleukin-1 receptor domain-containing protein [Albitalea sp.]